MARQRSEKVAALKAKLIARLRDELQQPGQRFFSNRAIAKQFGVSYLTAHRLVQELVTDGWLVRRSGAGTFVSGPVAELRGVELFFHARARRSDSFGARLHEQLRSTLAELGIATKVTWADKGSAPRADWLPVVWECPATVEALGEKRRFVLVLNDRPPPGLGASFVDSVSTDDFSGGAAAAELLRKVAPARRLAIFAGPRSDHRSQQRVAGFRAHARSAHVIWAGSWYADDAAIIARRLVNERFAGIFCCNDRLAEALLNAYSSVRKPPPPIVGFDDAPVAEHLNLTTIAIPWNEIVDGAIDIIRRRLDGDSGLAAQLIFAPRPVLRGTLKAR